MEPVDGHADTIESEGHPKSRSRRNDEQSFAPSDYPLYFIDRESSKF